MKWLAWEVGASERTLRRLFRTEFGATYPQWRTQVRVARAAVELSHGANVTEAAQRCGWATTSACVDTFSRVMGVTPGAYRARSNPSLGSSRADTSASGAFEVVGDEVEASRTHLVSQPAVAEEIVVPGSLVAGFYAPLSTGDVDSLDAILAVDWQIEPCLRAGRGREGWKARVRQLRAVLDAVEITIHAQVSSGDLVAVRVTTSATHVGLLMGAQPTGRRLEYQSSDFHRVDDGRIVKTWHLADCRAMAAQLGLGHVSTESLCELRL